MRVPNNTDAHAYIVSTAATSSFFSLNTRNGIEFSQSRQTFMHTTKEGGIIFTLLFLAQQGHIQTQGNMINNAPRVQIAKKNVPYTDMF